jgi:DNA-binding transcriptional regulator YiaG
MLPMVGVPETVRKGLRPYRELFRRDEGFEYVSRYVTGLLVNPNKTLQGIYASQVWPEKRPSRRAMHEAVFEAQWQADELLPRHRARIAPEPRDRGREVISLDWTLVHHERGPEIYGVTKSYDYVECRMARFQTTVTAVIANRQLIDGIGVQLKTLRAELGLTQPQLGEKLGVARNTVTRWEMGIRSIPEPVVRLLEFLRKEAQATGTKRKKS